MVLSGSQEIDALLGNSKWANSALSYSFPGYGASWSTSATLGYGPSSGGAEPWNISFAPLSASNQEFFSAALQQWANVANLQFSLVSDTAVNVGDIRVAFGYMNSYANAQAWSMTPGNNSVSGDVWFNSNGSSAVESWAPGSYSFFTALHELGHALGFKHPFYEAGSTGAELPASLDTMQYSVMSYTSPSNDLFRTLTYNANGTLSLRTDHVNPETPMVLDIAAMQYLYGANTTYNTGDDTYSFDTATPFYKTIWDAGGNDTISVGNFSRDCVIDLTPGNYSSIGIQSPAIPAGYTVSGGVAPTYDGTGNLGIAYGAIIENATGGSGNDTLTGNTADNLLDAAGGNDILNGGAGNDTLHGGLGYDTALYSAAYSKTVITYSQNANTYTLSSVADGIDSITGVEIFAFADQSVAAQGLTLASLVTGGANNDFFVGQTGSEVINGGSGVDTVSYAAPRSGFSIERVGTDYMISDVADVQGADMLSAVERIEFLDTKVAFDIDGVAGQAYRLYQAAFSRVPDTPGLSYWIANMDTANLTLMQTADLFTQSAEFHSLYGVNPSDSVFITALYANTLHRAPDPDGLLGWMSLLAGNLLSRPEVLIGFSESPENCLNVIGAIQNGITLDFV